ncbi:MAG: tetratricopeptide repeat protein [Myxococcota bacterium]
MNRTTGEGPHAPDLSDVGRAATLGAGPDAEGIEARVLLEGVRASMFQQSEPPNIGRFTVRSLLGRGAHGSVYLAEDAELDRLVAVKLIAGKGVGATARERLVREAQALAKLKHPNVLTIYEVGLADDRVFIAMEYAEAGTFGEWCRSHPPGSPGHFDALVDLAVAVGHGLAAAHAAGLVHRDIKPANILLGDDGRPRLADFGLATAVHGDAGTSLTAGEFAESEDTRDELTRTGDIVGTPAYMAPEQFAGRGTAASDQWSLCATLWEAAYGERPFAGQTVQALAKAVTQPPQGPRDRGSVPAWWRSTLARGLDPEPDARWPAVEDLVGELERRRDAARRKTARRLGIVGLVALVAVGTGWQVREVWRNAAKERCDAQGREIEALWPGRADSVRAGAVATGAGFAGPLIDRASPWLDAWATGWHEATRDLCVRVALSRDIEPDHELHAGMCLTLQRERVEGLFEALEQSDRSATEELVHRASSLPAAKDCLDPEWLARMAWPEADQVEAVMEIRARGARVAHRLRRADVSAIETARELVTRAEATGFAPLVAETELILGATLAAEEPVEAESRLRSAYFAAVRLDLPVLAAEAATQLEGVVVGGAGRLEDALEWGEHAEVWIERLGKRDHRLGASLADYVAAAHRALGNVQETIDAHERALKIRMDALGPAHPDVGRSLHNLGIAHAIAGDIDAAAAEFARSRELLTAALGPEHPEIDTTIVSLANVHGLRGEHDEAIALQRDLLRRAEAAYGPDSRNVGDALSNLGNSLSRRGSHDEAQAAHRRSLAIIEAVLGPRHQDTVRARINLGATLLKAGEFSEAAEHASRAVDDAAAAFAADHPHLAFARNNYGTILNKLGRFAEAEVPLRAALATREARLGPDAPPTLATKEQLDIATRGQAGD